MKIFNETMTVAGVGRYKLRGGVDLRGEASLIG